MNATQACESGASKCYLDDVSVNEDPRTWIFNFVSLRLFNQHSVRIHGALIHPNFLRVGPGCAKYYIINEKGKYY